MSLRGANFVYGRLGLPIDGGCRCRPTTPMILIGRVVYPVYFRDSFGDNEEGCLLALQEHLARGRESRHPGFHHPYHTASTLSTGLSYLSPR